MHGNIKSSVHRAAYERSFGHERKNQRETVVWIVIMRPIRELLGKWVSATFTGQFAHCISRRSGENIFKSRLQFSLREIFVRFTGAVFTLPDSTRENKTSYHSEKILVECVPIGVSECPTLNHCVPQIHKGGYEADLPRTLLKLLKSISFQSEKWLFDYTICGREERTGISEDEWV